MSEAFLAARSKIGLNKPYFGTALWALKFIEVENLAKRFKAAGDVGIDKHWRIYYDPAVVAKWTLRQRMGVLLHELGHVLRRHDKRAAIHGVGPENYLPWNGAADCALNDDIEQDSKLELPGDYVTPRKLDMPSGLTAEEYYDKMPRIEIPCNCGSGAHGQQQEWEQSEGDGRAKIEEYEAEAIARLTAERILEHKAQGTIPAGWVRWAENYFDPKVDWRKELATSIRRAAGDVRGMVDYSYRIVADTSGSMGEEDLKMVAAEIKGILAAMGNRSASYFAVDAEVHVAKKISSVRQVEFKGGGGTSMPAGIKRALEDKPKPDVIIVITDAYTDWMETGPPCKLIACIVNEEMEGPAYAKTINIPPTRS